MIKASRVSPAMMPLLSKERPPEPEPGMVLLVFAATGTAVYVFHGTKCLWENGWGYRLPDLLESPSFVGWVLAWQR